MRILVFLLMSVLSAPVLAGNAQVAVAANFAQTLKQLITLYTKGHPDDRIGVTVASTGKLAAQIRQGAPYDIFLAADQRRPAELAQEGLLLPASIRTYAQGILVLWTPTRGVPLGPESLRQGNVQPLALANARTAPYGVAAEAVLARVNLPVAVKQVTAENVGQSYHFAHSGAAAAAFVALSQVQQQGGSQWRVPADWYAPIVQQGGLLGANATAQRFYDFLFSPQAQTLIDQAGYRVPDDAF
ncbi:molybdate ABC transporter substrate-binding protein [Alcanivorax sp. VBW004]|uniref:molybdate ABC transporter substrate-binding protein n=1 Tax=Alcanivorax sp. VBW004 TaxID=1287708 RepID=UPI0012BC9C84|nr:molybdate ABC transporter substrate-binding protein [Alcanivorax sp. VBW004]MTT53523.1 molybdate ABC transporter substrate-binding protein [Alcanivorax sp. VBW004]